MEILCDRVIDIGRSFRYDATPDAKRHRKPIIVEPPRSSYAPEAPRSIDESRDSPGLTPAGLAKFPPVDRRTTWRDRKELCAASEDAWERIQTLRDLICFLDQALLAREGAQDWRCSPAPRLQGRRPIDLVRAGSLQ
jgi:hypothetical protein